MTFSTDISSVLVVGMSVPNGRCCLCGHWTKLRHKAVDLGDVGRRAALLHHAKLVLWSISEADSYFDISVRYWGYFTGLVGLGFGVLAGRTTGHYP